MIKLSDTIVDSAPKSLISRATISKLEIDDGADGVIVSAYLSTATIDAQTNAALTNGPRQRLTVALADMPNGDKTTLAELCALISDKYAANDPSIVSVRF